MLIKDSLWNFLVVKLHFGGHLSSRKDFRKLMHGYFLIALGKLKLPIAILFY